MRFWILVKNLTGYVHVKDAIRDRDDPSKERGVIHVREKLDGAKSSVHYKITVTIPSIAWKPTWAATVKFR